MGRRRSPAGAPPPSRLLVVSHVVHHRWQGGIAAYSPYVAELDQWAALFDEVVVASPVRDSAPPSDCTAFGAGNLWLAPVPQTGGDGLVAKVVQVAATPLLAVALLRQMVRADVVHVRCPGNLGLVGVAIAPLSRKPRIAKYAGLWGSFPTEPRTWRWQRGILRSRWWASPVTVYGRSASEPDQVLDFFSSAITADQAQRGRAAARRRRRGPRLRLLFVGRLTKPKHAEVVVEATARLRAAGIDVAARIIGDGPERAALEELAATTGAASAVVFDGALPLDEVLAAYEDCDTLVLASDSEGFPKAAAEAMCFGLVVVGSDIGHLRSMLADGRGVTVPPGDVDALVAALLRIADDPAGADAIGLRAADWAEAYTLDALRTAIAGIIRERWPQVHLTTPAG